MLNDGGPLLFLHQCWVAICRALLHVEVVPLLVWRDHGQIGATTLDMDRMACYPARSSPISGLPEQSVACIVLLRVLVMKGYMYAIAVACRPNLS